jgi:hypothetical protein|uniref:Uncharacterized protein n=1 Tax=Sipha flava TaxID=143950 RepID=A0A2S2QWI7_9HEMI
MDGLRCRDKNDGGEEMALTVVVVIVADVVGMAAVGPTSDEAEKGCDTGNPTEGSRANKGIFASNLKNLRVVCLTVFPLPAADFPTHNSTPQISCCARMQFETYYVHAANSINIIIIRHYV